MNSMLECLQRSRVILDFQYSISAYFSDLMHMIASHNEANMCLMQCAADSFLNDEAKTAGAFISCSTTTSYN